MYTNGTTIHGSPGSDKFCAFLLNSLFSPMLVLCVMMADLMGLRGKALWGSNLYYLFGLVVKKRENPYHLAELALDNQRRKSNLKFLHISLTIAILLIERI